MKLSYLSQLLGITFYVERTEDLDKWSSCIVSTEVLKACTVKTLFETEPTVLNFQI
jgi:hypothetical protein